MVTRSIEVAAVDARFSALLGITSPDTQDVVTQGCSSR